MKYYNQKLKTMQQQIFDDLTLLLPHLANLQQNIATLQELKRIVNKSETEIEILIHENKAHGLTYTLDQDSIPFTLKMEVQVLLNDSIDDLQRVYSNLASNLPE